MIENLTYYFFFLPIIIIKNISSLNSGKNQINLISADVWDKYYYKLLVKRLS
jgi:hypothetical protein